MTRIDTLCHVIDGDRILLKRAVRGVSKGKWNAAGGKVEEEETPAEGAARETFEETGLRVKNLFHHGVLNFFDNGKNEVVITCHLFSTREFTGKLQDSDEGEVRWFRVDELPWEDMWPDDKYWIKPMLEGKQFDADFYLDFSNSNLVKHEMRFR
jgi:8-oxo-dGTP pyrophosphatase MutT (NUDIX family)